MALNLSVCLTIIILLFPFLISQSYSQTLSSPETICNCTPHPAFCKSILPFNKPATILDYARISLQTSLDLSREILSLIQHYLCLDSSAPSLMDCSVLVDLSIDYLSQTLNRVNLSDTLEILEADELQTLLSAVSTNHQTCLDSLELITGSASGIKNGLITPLSNSTMLNSVSLALFKQGWVHDLIKIPRLLTETNHWNSERPRFLPTEISGPDRKIYMEVSGRKLLEVPSYGSNKVKVTKMVAVNPNGGGDFTTINEAVAAAPNNTQSTNQYFVIYVVAGVYQEYVSIPSSKKYLMMIGDGINRTIITGNRNVVDGSTTFGSATLAVMGKGFVAVNITFQNTAGAIKHQAVAVRVSADMCTFYKCSLEGYQDTLYAHSLRQFYRDCDIYGTVDFIFGNAAAVFQNCNIFLRMPLRGQFNAITAQGRIDLNQNTGTSLQNCTIKASDDLVSAGYAVKTYLGRPWKEYSRTVYLQNYMDGFIDPAGWMEWSGDFALTTLYYAEFENVGPGSNTSNRVKWPGYRVINQTEAVGFTVSDFLRGDSWMPVTGVPYSGTLMY